MKFSFNISLILLVCILVESTGKGDLEGTSYLVDVWSIIFISNSFLFMIIIHKSKCLIMGLDL